MNRFWIIIGAAVLILVVLLLILLLPKNQPQQVQQGPTSFPNPGQVSGTGVNGGGGVPGGSTGTNQGGQTGTGSNATMTIATYNGSTISVKDFIHNGATTPDVANPGQYFLAGSIGYCLKDGSCPSGAPAADFKVLYSTKKDFFTIALTKEPLGQARLHAQAFLEQALGLTDNQLCTLNYYIGTDISVSELYAGKNLGFSFCPNVTPLPS